MRRSLYTILILLCVTLQACFEYNPNQIILEDDEKDLTAKNIAKLQETTPSETIRFVFMGDTQRFYDESDDFVKSVNQLANIDFVVHGGDISDFGLVQEFKWIHEIMSGLKVPYLTVIGNHDLLANGRKVYREMYGELDYTFEYGNYRFIMLNTNSREFNFNGTVPDLMWLKQQLEDNTANKKTVVMSHIPPFDGDFDPNLEQEYAQLLAEDPNVELSLHAHRHSFFDNEYYDDGTRYFVTTSMQKRGYIVVTMSSQETQIEVINY
ncbi:metallophosphoesterase family protein [Fulvivirga imtechensis]|nr:metallophosphoesterase [Fulvivirga imtechensis]